MKYLAVSGCESIFLTILNHNLHLGLLRYILVSRALLSHSLVSPSNMSFLRHQQVRYPDSNNPARTFSVRKKKQRKISSRPFLRIFRLILVKISFEPGPSGIIFSLFPWLYAIRRFKERWPQQLWQRHKSMMWLVESGETIVLQVRHALKYILLT